VRAIAARRDLIREGESPHFVYLLLDGWACRYKTLADGRRQIVSFLLPGDIFDAGFLLLGKIDHGIAAITPIRVGGIGRDDFEALLEACPKIAKALWRGERIAASIQREWTLNVGQRTAFERLSHLLVETFLRLESVGLTNGQSCDWPPTQADLADATGLTAVHVNRMLQELRRSGLIALNGRALTIPDMAALKQAALFSAAYLHLAPRPGRTGEGA